MKTMRATEARKTALSFRIVQNQSAYNLAHKEIALRVNNGFFNTHVNKEMAIKGILEKEGYKVNYSPNDDYMTVHW